MTDFVSATASYERWLASHMAVVQKDLALKHERMSESPFVFLRATFYRWVELFPSVCGDLTELPHLAAVGDLHIENFGTWRDPEGRLVWGVNDLDEASTLPYVSDLVRLATSVAFALEDGHLRIGFRDACEAIGDLPKRRDEWKLLRAMGWETANVHLATPQVCRMVSRDLGRRNTRWLERATVAMAEATISDWKVWAARSRARA